MPNAAKAAKAARQAKRPKKTKTQTSPTSLGSTKPPDTSSTEGQQRTQLQQHETSRAVLKSLGARYTYNQDVGQDVKEIQPNTSSTSTDQKILEIVRHSLRPFSDKLDPFAQLPVVLDRFQEHLVSFYLLYYPKVTYGFSTRLKPHPVATNFSIAINNPPNFQVALARSALYRLTLQKYVTDQEKHDLEVAFIHHKGEAIKMVREMSRQVDSPGYKDNMIAAIISLGTLDRRTGSEDTASMHFTAVRRILRSIGGPLGIESMLLSRVMAHFETIYGSATESYIWDCDDTSGLLHEVNDFFGDIWNFRTSLRKRNSSASTDTSGEVSAEPLATSMVATLSNSSETTSETVVLPLNSPLRKALSRSQTESATNITPQGRINLIFQLTCLFTLSDLVLDLRYSPHDLKAYLLNLNNIIADAQLDRQPCNNHLWLIQIHDQTSDHSRRIWRAASFTWLLKRVDYAFQKDVQQWMLAFLSGEDMTEKTVMKLDPFQFSYAR